MRGDTAILLALLAAGTAAGPVAAQAAEAPARTIQVTGTGRVSTSPGLATIHLFVAGEGRTPDEASAALQAKQQAIATAVSGYLQSHAKLTDSNLVLIEARDPKCDITNTPRLSQGDCAVVGYVATIEDEIRTDLVDKAGTAAGLAGRMGARDARISGYELADQAAARKTAVSKAVADAHDQARLLASASGARLGPAVTIRDQSNMWSNDNEIVVTGALQRAPAPPPPPPTEIDVKPAPIDTQASVSITYALLP